MATYVLPIVLAILAGSGIPIWFLERFDKRNTNQHAQNLDILKDIQADVHDLQSDTREIASQLSRHLTWHMDKENNGVTTGRTGPQSKKTTLLGSKDTAKSVARNGKRTRRTNG